MIKKLKFVIKKGFFKIPIFHRLIINSRFKLERELIRGKNIAKSRHLSIIHFSHRKAATQYTKSILKRCANENGLIHLDFSGYSFNSNFPYLDGLSIEELKKYQHIFKPRGYLYSLFGGMIKGIPNSDLYLKVLMIRDPRDVLTSDFFSMAYSHKPPEGKNKLESFMKRRIYARKHGIDKYVLSQRQRYREIYQHYIDSLIDKPNVHITKYEDMILNFSAWLNSLLDFCQLKISPKLRQELLDEAKESYKKKEDKTKHRRQVLPGDHKRKLKPETIEILNSIFANVLNKFDYESSNTYPTHFE